MNKLRYFESYAGIGAVTKALLNKKINAELVGFSEIDKFAIKSFCAIHHVDKKLNFGDVCKIDEKDLPDFDFYSLGFPCFVKGTMVLTKEGYKPIEQITNEDEVMTHKNRFRKVVKPMVNHANHLYKVSTEISETLSTTEEHPFYIKENEQDEPKWIKAKDLKINMLVGTPISIYETNMIEEYPIDERKQMSKKYYLKVFNDYLNNENFWWLIGFANNNFVYQDTDMFILENVEKKHITKIISIIDEINSHILYEKKITYKISEDINEIIIQCKEIGDFVKYFVDKYDLYNLNKNILDLPNRLLKQLIDGLFNSLMDEYDENRKEFTLEKRFINKEFIYSLSYYFTKLYGKTTVSLDNEVYTITIKNKEMLNKTEKLIVWQKVLDIEKIDFNGPVYNMEVEQDNSYVVQNVIVHNCQDISVAGKQSGVKWTCGDCLNEIGLPTSWNPLDVHFSKRNKCPCCGSTNIIKTRSSLIVESLRIIRTKKPKYLLIENVKNLVSKDFLPHWNKIIKELDEYGYNTYWEVLNASNYNLPQNRERVIAVCILKELDTFNFSINKGQKTNLVLKDILQDCFDEKYFLSKTVQDRLTLYENPTTNIIGTTKPPYRNIGQRDVVYDTNKIIGCLTASDNKQPKQIIDKKTGLVRKLTPLEYIRLMGFSDEDFYTMKEESISDNQIYHQCGNSIAVNMLEEIFKDLFKDYKI